MKADLLKERDANDMITPFLVDRNALRIYELTTVKSYFESTRNPTGIGFLGKVEDS